MYEIFLDIEGYEGLYQVSNMGNVRSIERTIVYKNDRTQVYPSQIIKPYKNSKGYLQVCLHKNGKSKQHKVHRLVISTFKANPDNKPQINHINEDKTDNRLNNLEWCTASENINHGSRNTRMIESRKTNGTYIKCINNLSKCKQKKRVLCVSTGEIFESTCDAASNYNIRASGISACCLGKSKTCGGLKWKYIKEE